MSFSALQQLQSEFMCDKHREFGLVKFNSRFNVGGMGEFNLSTCE